MMNNELARFGRGFVYAWNGICLAVREERNFRFHLCAAVYACAAAWLAELDTAGFSLIVLCIGAVFGMELMNSAVERAVDKPDNPHWASAGAAKDLAAGGVLAAAIAAVIVAMLLFGETETRKLLWQKLSAQRWMLPAGIGGLLPCYWFVFCCFCKKK